MKRPGFALLIALWSVAPAAAHQLDEYLQATRLDISRDRVAVAIALTPGAAIASDVLALIDRDGDGSASATEIDTYARQVLRDVSLTVDGRAAAMTLTAVRFPAWDDVQQGLGTIHLELAAEAGWSGGAAHRVVYENRHQPSASVYTVNALRPTGRGVSIGSQRRDVQQHRLELEVEMAGNLESAAWLAAAALLVACSWKLRRRSRAVVFATR